MSEKYERLSLFLVILIVVVLVLIHKGVDDDYKILCVFLAEVENLSAYCGRKFIRLA